VARNLIDSNNSNDLHIKNSALGRFGHGRQIKLECQLNGGTGELWSTQTTGTRVPLENSWPEFNFDFYLEFYFYFYFYLVLKCRTI